MNNTTTFLCLIMAILMGQTSCMNINRTEKSGKVITKEWSPESFNEIEINAALEVKVVDGSAFHVKIEGDEAFVKPLEVTVNNNCLSIDVDKYNFGDGDDTEAIITVPSAIRSISLRGIGSVECSAKADPDQFSAKLSGIGKIEAENILSKRVNIESNGTGKVSISGRTDLLYARNTGIGKVDCKDLVSQTVDCVNTGIGKVTVHATDTLRAKSTGIGEIRYKGNPTNKEIKGSGIGGVNSTED